uniref:BTB domain-containing protein n=1 Tax=Panagrellus redivivus TaxID=6233 RepID=A0A7E4WCP0_PANRE
MTKVQTDVSADYETMDPPKVTDKGSLVFKTYGHFGKLENTDWYFRGYLDPQNEASVYMVLSVRIYMEPKPAVTRVCGVFEVAKEKTFAFGPVEFERSKQVTVIPSIPKDLLVNDSFFKKFRITFEHGDFGCKHFATSPTVFDCVTSAEHYVPDFGVTVGKKSLKVHRHFLSMVSPVFHAMLNDTSKDVQTSITIDDFDMATVKNTLDFCYGRGGTKPVPEVIEMLKFADKYDIKIATKCLTDHLDKILNYDNNFCAIAMYAWQHCKELRPRCVKFYKKFHREITLTPAFVGMPVEARDYFIIEAANAKIGDKDST